MLRFTRSLVLSTLVTGLAGQAFSQAIVLESQQLRAATATVNDDFGHDLALVGQRLFVSLYRTQRVQIFDLSSTGIEAEVLAGDGGSNDWFGYSIAADANRLVVGAPRHDSAGSNAGAAYVYVFDGSVWSFEQKLTATHPTANGDFGWAVAISGDTIVIGAPRADHLASSEQGSAHVFTLAAGNWTETMELSGFDSVEGDWFGTEVAIDGDLLTCSAENADATYPYSGAIYAYRKTAGSWAHEHKITTTEPGGTFGHRVDIEGDRLVVGMPYGGVAAAGVAIVYERVGGAWDSGFTCTVPYGASLDQVGTDVALSGDRFVAGAIFDWSWNDWSGSAYVFEKQGAAWVGTHRLISSDGRRDDIFGISVDFEDARVACGSPSWNSIEGPHERAYVYDLPAILGTRVCVGDGSGAACPCGNESTPGFDFGCENAYGYGAGLSGSGSASVAADDLVLSVEHMTHLPGWPPLGTVAQLVMGDVLLGGVIYGDGLRCAGGNLVRMGAPQVALSGGISWWGPGLRAQGGWAPGDQRFFQVWYRDVAIGGCGSHFNTSNALEVTFVP